MLVAILVAWLTTPWALTPQSDINNNMSFVTHPQRAKNCGMGYYHDTIDIYQETSRIGFLNAIIQWTGQYTMVYQRFWGKTGL